MEKINYKETTKRITLTAVLIGLAALCKLFSFKITIFGGSGMQVGLGGIFTAFPAFLFGPVYGGMASAASDIIGCIVNPSGAYNPLFTISAFAGGFIKGMIWMWLRKADPKKLRKIFACCFVVLTLIGIMFYACLASDGIIGGVISYEEEMPSKASLESGDVNFVTSLVVDRAAKAKNFEKNLAGYVNFATVGITGVGIFGLLMVMIEYLWSNRKERNDETAGVRIFSAIFISELIVTTINTVILKEMTMADSWSSYPFMVVWLPRAAEGLIICLIQAYFITVLYTLIKKINLQEMNFFEKRS